MTIELSISWPSNFIEKYSLALPINYSPISFSFVFNPNTPGAGRNAPPGRFYFITHPNFMKFGDFA